MAQIGKRDIDAFRNAVTGIRYRCVEEFQNFDVRQLNDPKELERLQEAANALVTLVSQSLEQGAYIGEGNIQDLEKTITQIKSCTSPKESRLFQDLLGNCKSLEAVLDRCKLSNERMRLDINHVERLHGLNQGVLNEKLMAYIEQRNPGDPDIGERVRAGVCHGLTQLYCYYQFLDQEQTFYSRVADAIESEVPIDEELRDKGYSELNEQEKKLEHLCNDILYLHGLFEGSSQIEPIESLQGASRKTEIQNLKSHLQLVSSYPCDKETKCYQTLEDTLSDIISSDHDQKKFISMRTINHAFGIFCKEGKCYVYDSNNQRRPPPFQVGQKGKAAVKEIVKELTSSLGTNELATALSIKVFSNTDLPGLTDVAEPEGELPVTDSSKQKLSLAETLQKNVDVGSEESYYQADPLHVALFDSPPEVVIDLIERGANINKLDSEGHSPLAAACHFGRKELAKTLIEKGADITIEGENKLSPLHSAARQGHTDCVDLLLENGADLNEVVDGGLTALHYASSQSDVGTVETLLAAGANIHHANSQGKTALYVAAEYDNSDVAKALIDHDRSTLDSINLEYRTPLHIAALKGNTRTARALISHTKDPDKKTHLGATPLHFSAASGDVQIIKDLVNKGAAVNMQDHSGSTPLHIACEKGNIKAVQALIKYGAEINLPNKKGKTPLCCAIMTSRAKITKGLINKGADVNSSSFRGSPLLHTAIKGRHSPTIKALLSATDINLDTLDNQDLTALHWAAVTGDKESIDSILDAGFDVNTRGAGGYTALHLAAQKGNAKAIEHLVNRGADVTASTEDGVTPLHLIAYSGVSDCLQLLHEKGASLDCVNSEGYTPLHIAIEEKKIGVIMGLLKRGADPLLKTNDGESGLDLANETKHPFIMEILKHYGYEVEINLSG